MTRGEALSMIIDGLDDVEQYDEALSVLRTDTGAEEATTWKAKYNDLSEKYAEEATAWKAKYNDLSEKYKARFKSEIMEQPKQALEKPTEEPVVPEATPTLDSLDFSAETE